MLPKRCIWYTSKGKGPDEKNLSEEKGLEEPGKVHPVDSQAAIFDQLSGVFTTTDPEAFAEKYEDVLDEMGKENAISIILSSRKIGEDLKWIIHEYLMDKFRKRASKKALDAIDELSARVGTPEGNDVAELAKEKLEGLAVGTWISDENEEPTYELQEVSEEEQTFYRSLADTVGALGMKK
ncbi:MAG: hypothetical protein U1C97_01185, partial [Candidatus Gracilibacteria bacterium]|nr:hypothetical protein [Candidatus Gracilibacteria bacterium]